MNDIAFTSAATLAELISTKKISPVEITELYLRRIEQLDPQLNSYLTVISDAALDNAKSCEASVMNGEHLGPLHGVPISVKDLELTNGIRTTGGSAIFKDRVPTEDSIVVERLKRSGSILLGKTNTPEFGLLGHTENLLGDHCRNPWNTDRTSGGSSGGAASSVVAGLCSMATGSDGGGSIRIPSSFCGVYGIKPSQHRVPMYSGAASPAVFNILSQSGPITRTVKDAALMLKVIAGNDSRDPASIRQSVDDYLDAMQHNIAGLRFGWTPDFGYAPVDPEVIQVTENSATLFEDMGCLVEKSNIVLDSPFETFWKLFSGVSCARYGNVLENHRSYLTDYARECIEHGEKLSAADYVQSLGQLDLIKSKFADAFEQHDLLLSPTMAVTAFPVGDPPSRIAGQNVDSFSGAFPFTYPINMIGYTAASIPCGFSADGLPIGLQIVGRPGDEATVIAASAAFEHAKPWLNCRPQVS